MTYRSDRANDVCRRLFFGSALLTASLIHRCAHAGGWTPEYVVEESFFQGVHFVDMQQTLDIKRHPGYGESSAFFDAGWAIGHHPSDRKVYAYFAAEALAHIGVTQLLIHYTSPTFVRLWESLSVSIDVDVVKHNASTGLTVHF